nr:MAG TPA: hypothetical protein [Caudoviricetes sp.]
MVFTDLSFIISVLSFCFLRYYFCSFIVAFFFCSSLFY